MWCFVVNAAAGYRTEVRVSGLGWTRAAHAMICASWFNKKCITVLNNFFVEEECVASWCRSVSTLDTVDAQFTLAVAVQSPLVGIHL